MSVQFDAVKGALSLLGKGTTEDNKNSAAVPTARTRAALDLLASSTPESLIAKEVDLRQLTRDLFDWSDKPRATKNLMRAVAEALNTPNKYSHAVELTAYLVALAPALEPDRLVRIYGALAEVNTAYAPAKYTLQLSHKLSRLLRPFPEERQEKLAYSLWIQAHKGRWWDLTSGGRDDAVAVDEAPVQETDAELIAKLREFELPWSPAVAVRFRDMPKNPLILEILEDYNSAYLKEKVLDPDIALISSSIPWLTPTQRTESPVGSLLDTLDSIVKAIDYTFPEKPKTFSELFPDIRLYDNTRFPFPDSILRQEGKMIDANSARLEVVRDSVILAENRDYMGNCTWSYKSRMEKGEYVLFRIHKGGEVYNGSMMIRSGRWGLGELNSRFNRGNVPTGLRNAFSAFIGTLPAPVPDNNVTKQVEANKKLAALHNRKYKYRVS